MLDDPSERQRIARDLVRESKPKDPDVDPRDVLSPWQRDMMVRVKNVTINIPMRDPIEVRRHLAMLEEACRDLRLQLMQRGTDQSHLILVRGTLRMVNQKINAYKKPALD